MQGPVRPGGPLRDPGAPSRPSCTLRRRQPRAQAPWASAKVLASWNALAPAQAADERARAAASSQVVGNVRSHPVPRPWGRKDRRPPLRPITVLSPFSRQSSNFDPPKGLAEKVVPPSPPHPDPQQKKNSWFQARGNARILNACWRGWRLGSFATLSGQIRASGPGAAAAEPGPQPPGPAPAVWSQVTDSFSPPATGVHVRRTQARVHRAHHLACPRGGAFNTQTRML